MDRAAVQLDYVIIWLEHAQADRALLGVDFFINLDCARVVVDVIFKLVYFHFADQGTLRVAVVGVHVVPVLEHVDGGVGEHAVELLVPVGPDDVENIHPGLAPYRPDARAVSLDHQGHEVY